ncbi:MAG: cob(I)yrinic acid a,c-diamide adenosyltransferase [Isosphaeraceae bacterium]
MKIYTKTGDDGTTGLLGPGRLRKDAARIEAYGTVDELNALVGVARSHPIDAEVDAFLAQVQDELFAVGAALADPDPQGRFHQAITARHIERIEQAIDALEARLPPLQQFILPGGTPGAALLHLARTVCRRAERQVVHLMHEAGEHVDPPLLVYLNRLSDALFVAARVANRAESVPDRPWGGL